MFPLIFVSNVTMFLHEAWSWKSFASFYPARKMSAGTESSFCESRHRRKIVKDPRTVFLRSNDKYLLTLSRYLSWPDCSCFLPFSSSFFPPSFFVDRPTNDHVLCGDLLLGKSKKKLKEEARVIPCQCSKRQKLEHRGGREKRCMVIVDSSVP